MNESGKRCLTWSMLALVAISTAGCTLVFTDGSATAQNAACILCGAAFCVVIVQRLQKASDVVDAALRLAEEIARLSGDLPEASQSQEHPETSLAVVRSLPGQRAAAGQAADTPWYEDRQ